MSLFKVWIFIMFNLFCSYLSKIFICVICFYCEVLDIWEFSIHLGHVWSWSYHWWLHMCNQMEVHAWSFRWSSSVQAEDRCIDYGWFHMDTICRPYNASEVRRRFLFSGSLWWESFVVVYLAEWCLREFSHV